MLLYQAIPGNKDCERDRQGALNKSGYLKPKRTTCHHNNSHYMLQLLTLAIFTSITCFTATSKVGAFKEDMLGAHQVPPPKLADGLLPHTSLAPTLERSETWKA